MGKIVKANLVNNNDVNIKTYGVGSSTAKPAANISIFETGDDLLAGEKNNYNFDANIVIPELLDLFQNGNVQSFLQQFHIFEDVPDEVVDNNPGTTPTNQTPSNENVVEEQAPTEQAPESTSTPAEQPDVPAENASTGQASNNSASEKSIDELAREVLNGQYGNGQDRRKALGDKYEAVQKRVNELLGLGAATTTTQNNNSNSGNNNSSNNNSNNSNNTPNPSTPNNNTNNTGSNNNSNNNANGNIKYVNGNVIDTSQPCYNGKQYNLSEYQLRRLAYLAYKEQGSLDGAKIELSQMANLTENRGKSDVYSHVFSGSNSFYGPVKRGEIPDNPNVPQEYVDLARDVLVNGNRYLPQNVYEHDCIYDYTSKGKRYRDVSKIVTNGVTYTGESIENRSNYIPGETVIYASSGSKYVFDGFAPNGGDPFGHVVGQW